MIKGGYILQPRIIQESDISVAAPCVREIWNYLLREANNAEARYNGHVIKRGQLFRSYDDIKDGTKWYVGWRKMTYSESQTKKAMKFLRDTGRIETMKELGGVLITICKYDYYQDPKNYGRTTKCTTEVTIEEPLNNHYIPHNNNNKEKNKNERNIILPYQSELFVSTWEILINEKKWKGKSENALQESANILGRYQESVAVEMMKKSIAAGWQGIFELKENDISKKSINGFRLI